FQLGHTPIIGEWLALPLMRMAGSQEVGDEIYTAISYPIAHRILRNCDGVLRIEGKSTGADQDVAVARELGLHIFNSLDQISVVAKPNS
ncbi:MAG: NUDIX hydrolase, partial [Bacteroidota bacterium]